MNFETDEQAVEETPVEQSVVEPTQPSEPAQGAEPVNPKPEEVIDWTSDKRFDSMWKKDPNNLYKSYKELEKGYQPLKTKYDSFSKLLKDHGVEADKLEDVFGEWKKFSSPDSQERKFFDYFWGWANNPMYRGDIENFFSALETKEMQRRFPGMNEEQIQRMVALENEIKGFREKEEQRSQKELETQFASEIEQGINRVKEYSSKYGFNFNEELQAELLEYCASNNVPTKYVFQAFLEKYHDQLQKSVSSKVESDVLARLNKQKGAVIPGGGSKKPGTTQGMSFEDKLRQFVN